MQTNTGKTSIHSAYHMYRREELLERRGQSERDHLWGVFLRKLHDTNTFQHKKTFAVTLRIQTSPSWQRAVGTRYMQGHKHRHGLQPHRLLWLGHLLSLWGWGSHVTASTPSYSMQWHRDKPWALPTAFLQAPLPGVPSALLPSEHWLEPQSITAGKHNRRGEKSANIMIAMGNHTWGTNSLRQS